MYSAEEFRQKVLTVLNNIIHFPFEERHEVNPDDIASLSTIHQNIALLYLADTNGISNFFAKSQILHQLLKPFYSEVPERDDSPFVTKNIVIKLAITLLITESFHDAYDDNDPAIKFLSGILGPNYSEEQDKAPKQLDTFLQSPNFVRRVLQAYRLLTEDDRKILNLCLDGRFIVSIETLKEYFRHDSFSAIMQHISQLVDKPYLIAKLTDGTPELTVNVDMNQILIVCSNLVDPRYVIGTTGVANCTALVVNATLNNKLQLHGVAHCPGEIVPMYQEMLSQMQARASGLGTVLDQSSILIHLVGGMVSSMGYIARFLSSMNNQIGVIVCGSNVADGELSIKLCPFNRIEIYLNKIPDLSLERLMELGLVGAVPPPPPPILFAAAPAAVVAQSNVAAGSRYPIVTFDFALPVLSDEEEGPGGESPPSRRLRLAE